LLNPVGHKNTRTFTSLAEAEAAAETGNGEVSSALSALQATTTWLAVGVVLLILLAITGVEEVAAGPT
jgi:hypothetical protein